MKKYILTLLLILAVMISYGQSDPAPTAPANAVSIQGFAKINGADTVHTGYQSGFGFIDLAGRSWTSKNFASLLVPTSVKTANYTAAVRDLVLVNTTSGVITITLPAKPVDKSLIAIKHIIQGGANTVTVSAGATDVFNQTGGSTSITLKTLNQGVLLQYSSAGIWYVLSDDLPLSSLDLRYANALTTSAGSAPTLINGVLNIPPASSSSGTVSSVSSANSDISVATGTTTPVLTLNSGTGANQIVKRDASGNLNATTVTTNANLTGPVTSVGNATTINNINGITPTYYDPTSSIQTQLNAKQSELTLTTTGATGTAATLTGNTLNIPTPSLTYGSYTQNNLGSTLSDAILLQNTTAAISGTGQSSPATHWKGNVWSTSASASKSVDFYANILPYQNGPGAGYWQLLSSLNGSTPAQVFSVDNSGSVFCAGYFYTPQMVQIGQGLQVTGGTTYNLTIADPQYSNGASTNSGYAFAGSSSVVSRIIFNSISSGKPASLSSGQSYASEIFAMSPVNTTASTTNPWIVNALINSNTITLGSGASVNNTSNLFVNYPSNVGTNNYALYVAGGPSGFAAVSVQTPTGSATDSVATKSGTSGNLGAVPISNFITTSAGRIGQTTLAAGTKTIAIAGLTTASKAFLSFVSAGGTVSTTWQYAGVCTAGTLTITALTTGNSTNTADTSTINYNVIQ
jgi:hypothetical protein